MLQIYFCPAPSAPIEVTISPNNPDPFPVREGDRATFRCSVPADVPISAIRWSQSSGEALTGITQAVNSLLLTLTADSKDSNTVYTCTVVDAAGRNASQSITLTVIGELVLELCLAG